MSTSSRMENPAVESQRFLSGPIRGSVAVTTKFTWSPSRVPSRDILPGLSVFTPYPADFGLHAGTAGSVFEYQKWRMLPLICFEDTVPHLVRNLMAASTSTVKGDIDLLVNLSNDGWFHGSSGLDQHLVTAAFRAVECRCRWCAR